MLSRKLRLFPSFFHDENAQATIEYILIVSVLVSIAVLLIRDLIRPLLEKLTSSITDAIQNGMFNPETMHRSPFKK